MCSRHKLKYETSKQLISKKKEFDILGNMLIHTAGEK